MAFRQKTLLPLDDCLHALQRTIPSVTRSSLHRFYQHYGVSQRPRSTEPDREKKPFKRYPLGYLHIDITEARTAEGKAYLFVAINRTTKFVHADRYTQATLKALPYRVHRILTDNGIPFTKKPGTEAYRAHPFDALYQRHGTEHCLTKPFHPWTNGQVDRMNRTIDRPSRLTAPRLRRSGRICRTTSGPITTHVRYAL